MAESISQTWKRFRGNRFTYLLLALVLTLILVPVLRTGVVKNVVQHACLTAIFITAVVANRQRRRVLIAGISVAVVAVSLDWITLFVSTPALVIASHVSAVLFLGVTAAMILVSVLRDHMATRQAVVGAICVYLLIGLTWALMYSSLDYLQEEPFDNPHRHVAQMRQGREQTSYSQMVYFSFVTMSTLGYGDITPRTPLAETLTWTQSVFGQLYLAVLIARLVSILPGTLQNRQQT
jgi:hypothetical protein